MCCRPLPMRALPRHMCRMTSLSRVIVFLSPLAVSPAAAADIVVAKEPTGGQVVTITGTISRGDGLKVQRLFDDALRNGDRVTTLVLNSGGGSGDDGVTIARLVAAAKATTVVPAQGVCSSACFIPWAAGVVPGSFALGQIRKGISEELSRLAGTEDQLSSSAGGDADNE
jgi:hypothetical protein